MLLCPVPYLYTDKLRLSIDQMDKADWPCTGGPAAHPAAIAGFANGPTAARAAKRMREAVTWIEEHWQPLSCLAAHVAGDFLISRQVDAPRERV